MKLELAMQPGFNFAKKNRFHRKKIAIFSSRSFTDFFFFAKKNFNFAEFFFYYFFKSVFPRFCFRDFFVAKINFEFAEFFLLFFQVALSAIFFPVENSFIRSLD